MENKGLPRIAGAAGLLVLLAGALAFCGVLWDGGIAPTTAIVSPAPAAVPEVVQKPTTIVLDAGHGGELSGASYDSIDEKDINLTVTLKVQARLEALGYLVAMTRTTDVAVGLYERADIADRAGGDVLVSIHSNALEDHIEIQGIMTYHCPEAVEGAALSEAIQSRMLEETGATDQGVQSEDFVVLREPDMCAALVEIGFMSNPEELKKLLTEDYQNLLAMGIADGIHSYLTERGLEPSEALQESQILHPME